jgi:hypothetical protein
VSRQSRRSDVREGHTAAFNSGAPLGDWGALQTRSATSLVPSWSAPLLVAPLLVLALNLKPRHPLVLDNAPPPITGSDYRLDSTQTHKKPVARVSSRG